MRQSKRQVTDKATICAMLDAIDTIHVAMHDEPFPYVVPLNFGYDWKDKLVFYFLARMRAISSTCCTKTRTSASMRRALFPTRARASRAICMITVR